MTSVGKCGSLCESSFSFAIFLYGSSLGALGAVSYQLFGVGRIIIDEKLSPTDVYGSYSRILLGAIFGLLFAIVFSRVALIQTFTFDSDDANYATAQQYLFFMLPFLAGYSSTLVTGLLNKLVEAVSIALRLETK
ncbi:hypothetical protein [Neorhizobium alkalisoli]|uniref:Uncharacterized protein n=1 Tax=Neorhizobium alkalisoli TaxID=528178 RepID=A0A561Q7T7_9HYPH|nr:hypothetical protein [Neorhizobium alkalisoli]TWF46418.1 hypothetical protein FHW37_115115 [Neorhizobium alkalisoli]